MKVLHVIEATATGTLSMAALLANAQQAEGHEVVVAYSKREETPADFEKLFSNGVSFAEFTMAKLNGKFISAWKLSSYINEIEPDKMFLHSSFAGFIGRIAGLKSSYSGEIYYIPHCISFMRQDVGGMKRKFFIAMEKVAAIKKSTYIACSFSEKNAISKYLPKQDSVVIENAVENKYFVDKAKCVAPDNKYKVITVGQIRSQKNPATFANIAKKAKSLGLDIEFIWVGDGDPSDKQNLIDAGVNVTGWLSREQVIDALYQANIYLSTARWEGLPVSLIEANYAGIPVVASICAGNVDVVQHGVSGYLFSSEEEAVEWITLLCKHKDTREEISSRARDVALRRFSVSRYKRQMSDLLNGNRNSPSELALQE